MELTPMDVKSDEMRFGPNSIRTHKQMPVDMIQLSSRSILQHRVLPLFTSYMILLILLEQVNSSSSSLSFTTTSSSNITFTQPVPSSNSMTSTNHSTPTTTLPIILHQVLYPRNEVMDLLPVNQFYYPMLFPFDVQYHDFCSTTTTPHTIHHDDSFCTNYLCESTFTWNLRNKSQIMELGSTINYCLYCNQSQSNEFRKALQQGNCSLFTRNEFTLWSQVHCNNVPYSKSSHPSNDENHLTLKRHLGLFDFNFLLTPYFQINFLKYRRMENESLTFGDALREVKLETLFQFYFSKYVNPMSREYDMSTTRSIQQHHQPPDIIIPPLDVPFTCWCNYQNSNEQYFAFQCDDFYQKFLFHFTHRYAHIVLCIIFSVLSIMISFLILYPKARDMISITLDLKLNHGLVKVNNFSKCNLFGKRLLAILSALSSISVQSSAFFVVACFCGFMENFLKFLFNFSAVSSFQNNYFKGFFRAMCCVFIVCGYSSLVISWSHFVSNKQGSTSPTSLSLFHKSMLGLFYGSTVIVMLVAAILYVVTSNISYAWISLAGTGLFYLLSFVAGFAIFGLKILYRLRQLRNTIRSFEYRFTKLMLLLTLTLVSGWIIVLLTLFTYIFGFDAASLFYGITRNVWLDCGMISVTLAFAYTTFNVELLKKAYRNSKLCCCFSSEKKKKQQNDYEQEHVDNQDDGDDDDELSSQMYYTGENRVEVVLKSSTSKLMSLPSPSLTLAENHHPTVATTDFETDSHMATTHYSQLYNTE
ncbi:hypothetical protein C9374_009554 [Naegleria lovaniensis]|uniref:Uncharacterized protein n=1 Tax=Naegleria lovaniensis TaxID=51637 RepID=A0AA88KR73_NAELO|nr:uncharacterized protein C9374_009554 [Naegleria lovaniensis]KAG2392977.1 hypothetical protein C9374_009554 [Naegleria lovaniensis]